VPTVCFIILLFPAGIDTFLTQLVRRFFPFFKNFPGFDALVLIADVALPRCPHETCVDYAATMSDAPFALHLFSKQRQESFLRPTFHQPFSKSSARLGVPNL
jgi:hypothetical protein